MHDAADPILILGAGPAGLAIAHAATQLGRPATIIEGSATVGGLSKTIEFAGARVDLGPHVVGNDYPRANALFERAMGEHEQRFVRRTTMHWRDRVYRYPPSPIQLVAGVGPIEAARFIASFVGARLSPGRGAPPEHYLESARRKFGPRLVDTCIAPYIGKLWGIPADRIAPDWEPGRVRNQSFFRLITEALFARADERVPHPRNGMGQMYDSLAGSLRAQGVDIQLGQRAGSIRHDGERITGITLTPDRSSDMHTDRAADHPDDRTVGAGEQIFSTLPLPLFVRMLEPGLPTDLLGRLGAMRFRGTRLVYVHADTELGFTDHIRYVNDPAFTAGRITNFSVWTDGMGKPTGGGTVLCHESWADDAELNAEPDDRLIGRALAELERLGITDRSACIKAEVVRIPRTHPICTHDALAALAEAKAHLEPIENLHIAGRGGSFLYADQDRVIDDSMAIAERVLAPGSAR